MICSKIYMIVEMCVMCRTDTYTLPQIKDLHFRLYPQFKHILSCSEIDIQYAVNVKADVDGSDPVKTEGLEDLRLG